MRKIFVTLLLILLVPVACSAEYMKLTSAQKEKWTKPRAIAEVEKAAKNNTAVDYLGRMSQNKLEYIKKYGCPDVVGRYNLKDKETGEKVEEWLYYGPAKYIYFHEKSGGTWKEEPLTELDKISASGKVEIDMNETQVMRAKGAPSHIDKDPNPYGADEKWVYDSMYVWLKGGKVVHCQK